MARRDRREAESYYGSESLEALRRFRIELRNVTLNAGVIAGVMREVDRLRAERGLESNAEALANSKDAR